MPKVTYSGEEKSGIILLYYAGSEELFLPYVQSSAPDAYTIYMASDDQGNIKPAFSVTPTGWQSLQDAVQNVVSQYVSSNVSYGGPDESDFDSYSIIFDPE